MHTEHRYIAIIAGGGGTRLWPLSRKNQPKQFQKLTGDESLFQQMVQLSTQVVSPDHIFVQSLPIYKDTIQEQASSLPEQNIFFEPALRDTGPAIALALMRIRLLDPEAQVAVLWSDHYVQQPAAFAQVLKAAFAASADHPDAVVTVGAKPTFPNTGFGYIQMGDEIGKYEELPVFQVRQFKEKPDLATAQEYISSWEYLWNVGYEIMNVQHFFSTLATVQPELQPTFEKIEEAVKTGNDAELASLYEGLTKQSIELLFTTHIDTILVVPADMGWSDVGTWDVLHTELSATSENGIVTQGPVRTVDSKDVLVYAKDRPITVVGLSNLVVVDAGDSVLIMAKEAAQNIKKVVQQLEETNPELL